MAIGYSALETANVAYLNRQLGDLAVQLRSWADQVAAFHDQVVVPLGPAGLEAAGFTPDDASAFAYKTDVINTVAALYYGRAAQPDQYSFDSALADVRGPHIRA